MSSRAGPRTPPKATGRDKGKGRARDAAEPEGYYKGEPKEEQIAMVESEMAEGRIDCWYWLGCERAPQKFLVLPPPRLK